MCIYFQVTYDLYRAGVLPFVLHHSGREDCCTDPGLGHVMAQFRHTEDARLHQAPAGTNTEETINILFLLNIHYWVHYISGITTTNLSFSDSWNFLTAKRQKDISHIRRYGMYQKSRTTNCFTFYS